MNGQSLKKLNETLRDKWLHITEECFQQKYNGNHAVNAHLRWHELCDSLEIERMNATEDEFLHHGEILEESVVVNNPAIEGSWIQMPKETATKILAIGIP